MDDYAKITTHKKFHTKLRKISKDTGIKIYRLVDEAIENYINSKFPQYLEEQTIKE